MARVSANSGGDIVEFLPTRTQERLHPTPPAGAVYTLHYDEDTNAGLYASYQANSAVFGMPGGTLTVSGVPATVNPPGAYDAAIATIPGVVAKLDGVTPLTTAEVHGVLRVLLRDSGRITA